MISNKCTFSTFSLALLQASAFFSVQCQLLTFVASGRSSTIHLGSPSPHLAILVLKLKFCYTAHHFPVTHNNSRKFHHTALCSIPSCTDCRCCYRQSLVSCTTTLHYTRPATDHRNHRRSSHIDNQDTGYHVVVNLLHWEIMTEIRNPKESSEISQEDSLICMNVL